jgi:hypothetical protein
MEEHRGVGPRPGVSRAVLYLVMVGLGCTRPAPAAAPPPARPVAKPPAPPAAKAPAPNRLALLMDIATEEEAGALAAIKGTEWQDAALAGAEMVKKVAKPGTLYQLLPSATQATPGGKGKLSGKVREECNDFYLALAKPSPGTGFAVASTTGEPVHAVELKSGKIEPGYVAIVANIVERASKRKVRPRIERAYRVDLDGNGKPEVVLQATHPALNGDPAKYRPEYYSLLVVLPDTEGAEPVYTGYLQADKELSSFEVVTLDAVADLDLDGRRELIVRARYEEGFQTQVFAYDGKLKDLFHSASGERECPGSGQ